MDPIWITLPVVRAIHGRQIAEFGGDSGVRDAGLLESALARAQNRHAYAEDGSDIPALAACLAYGICKNHPFVDGNKRVAAVVAETFVILNGWVLAASNESLFLTILSLAQGNVTEDELIAWFRANCNPITGNG